MSLDKLFPFIGAEEVKTFLIAGITEIQVETLTSVEQVMVFGDSLTHMSYYSDALYEYFLTKREGEVTLINQGICGNRLLWCEQ